MKVLVVGAGGREHALCWAIAKSPLCEKLFCAPGNAGIAQIAECLPIAVEKIDSIVAACKDKQIDFVVIGPELPLTLGLANALRAANIACFGPSKAAAALEGSKGFMKDLCARAGIPTAAYKRFTDAAMAKEYVKAQGAPIVVKADGLAAGKGVTVARTVEEAFAAIDDAMVKKVFGAAGGEVVIEEYLEGEEVSFFALCDGETALPFAAAQDHKTAYDGDNGPNTGGMGAYSPAPVFDSVMEARAMREIILPTVTAMKEMGAPFAGILFAGLMITKDGPKLIEFNVRFGDPETEAMLPRLKSDLLALLYAAAKGFLDGVKIEWHARAALCVVMAAKGYPGAYEKGSVIGGLDDAAKIENAFVYHSGTAKNDKGDITANGGRVLCVTGWGATIAEAQTRAYQAVDKIIWPEGFCRRDIGWRAVKSTKAA
ncbi:MAG TPA: phosphoribosylamine--glycine ligase [Alphaproteobacteria bacterium]|nr:phosphoribosylamine--glycine ligase [Alphaproteobacteria bacterium]